MSLIFLLFFFFCICQALKYFPASVIRVHLFYYLSLASPECFANFYPEAFPLTKSWQLLYDRTGCVQLTLCVFSNIKNKPHKRAIPGCQLRRCIAALLQVHSFSFIVLVQLLAMTRTFLIQLLLLVHFSVGCWYQHHVALKSPRYQQPYLTELRNNRRLTGALGEGLVLAKRTL